jgi:hypothetical protein
VVWSIPRPGTCAPSARTTASGSRPEGQQWTTLHELTEAGHRTQLRELEPGLFGLTAEPGVGIGQQAHLVVTPDGNLLWDPPGYLDDEGVRAVREHGEVVAIASSHPHMFGVQVEWSHALGGVPVLVSEPDAGWVARQDPVIRTWKGPLELVPGSPCTSRVVTSPAARSRTGRPAQRAGACCWAGTRSRRTPTARRPR